MIEEPVIEDPMIVFFALEPQSFPVIELNFDDPNEPATEPVSPAPVSPAPVSPAPVPTEPANPTDPSISNPSTSVQIHLPDQFENDTSNQFNLRFSYRPQTTR